MGMTTKNRRIPTTGGKVIAMGMATNTSIVGKKTPPRQMKQGAKPSNYRPR